MVEKKYYMMVPPETVEIIAEVFKYGAEVRGYNGPTWVTETVESHVLKALGHLVKWLKKSVEEDHLACALTRLAMAATLRRRKLQAVGTDIATENKQVYLGP
jgi:hypothetical protein